MKAPIPRPSYAKAGVNRDAEYVRLARESATPPVAESANVVNAAPEKPTLEDDDFLALVEADGTITPLSPATLKTWLEANYILTPQP